MSDPRIARRHAQYLVLHQTIRSYQTIKDSVTELGFKQLVDGNIMDDIDDFRPGIKARTKLGVRKCLARSRPL
ncbi:MAG: hypothetical protein ACLVJN_09165 [Streptococcus parasanguinis]